MFGFARRRATATAIEATLPLIRMLEIAGPLPSRFWADPCVLGYLLCVITTFAKASTDGRLSRTDIGRCVIDTFAAISQRDGAEIGMLATRLAEQQNQDFLNGMRNADKVIAVTYGSRDFDDDPDVVAAIQLADSIGNSLDVLGPTNRTTRIASYLGTIAFGDRVKHRLGLETE